MRLLISLKKSFNLFKIKHKVKGEDDGWTIEENGKQKIVHSQEQPEYKKEYLFETGTPFLCAKIFVIDDVTHSTMLFNYEY